MTGKICSLSNTTARFCHLCTVCSGMPLHDKPVQVNHQETRIFLVSLSLDLTHKQANTAVSTKMMEAKLSRNGRQEAWNFTGSELSEKATLPSPETK